MLNDEMAEDSDVESVSNSFGILKVDNEKHKAMYYGDSHWHMVLSDVCTFYSCSRIAININSRLLRSRIILRIIKRSLRSIIRMSRHPSRFLLKMAWLSLTRNPLPRKSSCERNYQGNLPSISWSLDISILMTQLCMLFILRLSINNYTIIGRILARHLLSGWVYCIL